MTDLDPKALEAAARAINEAANKQFNMWMCGKSESITLARAAILAYLSAVGKG